MLPFFLSNETKSFLVIAWFFPFFIFINIPFPSNLSRDIWCIFAFDRANDNLNDGRQLKNVGNLYKTSDRGEPSIIADIEITKKLIHAGKILDIRIISHVIVTKDTWNELENND